MANTELDQTVILDMNASTILRQKETMYKILDHLESLETAVDKVNIGKNKKGIVYSQLEYHLKNSDAHMLNELKSRGISGTSRHLLRDYVLKCCIDHVYNSVKEVKKLYSNQLIEEKDFDCSYSNGIMTIELNDIYGLVCEVDGIYYLANIVKFTKSDSWSVEFSTNKRMEVSVDPSKLQTITSFKLKSKK